MDGDVVEEDFGGFGGDSGEGEGGEAAGEGGDGPEIGAGEEALEVGGGEGDSVVFEDFGEEEEEGSREGFVGWLEAGGADGERREFWRYRNHFSGPPGFEAPAGRLRVRAVCVIAACRLRKGGNSVGSIAAAGTSGINSPMVPAALNRPLPRAGETERVILALRDSFPHIR